MKIDLSSKNIMAYILTWLVIGVFLLISFTYFFGSRVVSI